MSQNYQNSTNFEQSSIAQFIKSAPTLLLVSMMLSFVLMLAVQMFYYSTIFEARVPSLALAYSISIGIALMFQSARFSFGIAGAYEFAKGETGKGFFGLLFSLGLTIFESFEVAEMTMVWTRQQPEFRDTLNMVLQAMLWLGFALEIRLLTNVAGRGKVEAPTHTDSRIDDNKGYTDNRMHAKPEVEVDIEKKYKGRSFEGMTQEELDEVTSFFNKRAAQNFTQANGTNGRARTAGAQ